MANPRITFAWQYSTMQYLCLAIGTMPRRCDVLLCSAFAMLCKSLCRHTLPLPCHAIPCRCNARIRVHCLSVALPHSAFAKHNIDIALLNHATPLLNHAWLRLAFAVPCLALHSFAIALLWAVMQSETMPLLCLAARNHAVALPWEAMPLQCSTVQWPAFPLQFIAPHSPALPMLYLTMPCFTMLCLCDSTPRIAIALLFISLPWLALPLQFNA